MSTTQLADQQHPWIGLAPFTESDCEFFAGRGEETTFEPEAVPAPRPPRWRRKKHIIAELEVELAGTVKELEEHRQALANLATQLSRESEAALGEGPRLVCAQHVHPG